MFKKWNDNRSTRTQATIIFRECREFNPVLQFRHADGSVNLVSKGLDERSTKRQKSRHLSGKCELAMNWAVLERVG
jgi:hypothetical protein